jgi:KaiC/GvpD/RAD55 family RecA-like ATPase
MVNKDKFFKTGIRGFDELLGYGIPTGSNVIVEGGPGSGKTTFCLHILNNACLSGKKCLYMSFEEPEYRLLDHMTSFGWSPDKFQGKLLEVKRFDALEIARSVEAMLARAEKELLIDIHDNLIPRNFNPEIIVVDSLSAIAEAFTGMENRYRIYMQQFFKYLEKNNITSFLIRETAYPGRTGNVYPEKGEVVSFLADGIISIYNIMDKFGKRCSGIEVYKMRGTDITRKIVQMRIANGIGVEVFPGLSIGEKIRGDFFFT